MRILTTAGLGGRIATCLHNAAPGVSRIKYPPLYLPQRTINVDWYTSTKIQTLYQIALVKSFVVFAEFVPRNTAERTNRIPVYFFM
jgi:hypothetical protein